LRFSSGNAPETLVPNGGSFDALKEGCEMMTNFRPQTQLLHANFDTAWFETMFQAMDRLHDAVSDDAVLPGHLSVVSPLVPAEMVGWLEEIIYTAQETIHEIQAKQPVTEAENLGIG
jgi:hypothetical protein